MQVGEVDFNLRYEGGGSITSHVVARIIQQSFFFWIEFVAQVLKMVHKAGIEVGFERSVVVVEVHKVRGQAGGPRAACLWNRSFE